MNAGNFCIIRLRRPRHPSSLGYKWRDVWTAGPLFAGDGTPYKRDWHGEMIPYLDRVVDANIGWDPGDVMRGDFMGAQLRRKWTQEQEAAAFRARTLEQAATWKSQFDQQAELLSGLTALEHKKMNIRGEVITKEDIRQAIKDEPRMQRILDEGVNFDKYLLSQVGLE